MQSQQFSEMVETGRYFCLLCNFVCCTALNSLGIAQKSSSDSCGGLVRGRMFCFLDNTYFPLGNSPTFGELYSTRTAKTDCKVSSTRDRRPCWNIKN